MPAFYLARLAFSGLYQTFSLRPVSLHLLQGLGRGSCQSFAFLSLCADSLELPPFGESLMDLHPGQAEVRP